MEKNMADEMPAIRKTIVFKAPIEKVWKTVSTSEGIETWWMANTMKAEIGNHFVLHTGNYGDSPCTITELDPPYRLGFDWDRDWHVTFELKDLGDGRTEFTLIHSGWFKDKKTGFGQPHTEIRKVMDTGWERIIRETLPSRIEEK